MDSSFKFKFVLNGNAKGFLSSKGSVNSNGLTLGEELLPHSAVVDSTTRDNRLILVLNLQHPDIGSNIRSHLMDNAIVLEVYGGKEEALERAIDKFSSALSANAHKAELEAAGEGHTFHSEVCPACESTVDLTGYDKTNFVYCRYCESLFGDGLESLKGAAQYRTCDECGYHDRVQGYGEFYFYFLLIVYGFSHNRRHMCDACGKSLANKLLAINAIFLLGVPNAIACMVRARAGKDERMKGLAEGNHYSKKGQLDKAEEHYKKALKIFKDHPGVHYNRALGHLSSGSTKEGLDALVACLEACPNYLPAQRLQLQIMRAVQEG